MVVLTGNLATFHLLRKSKSFDLLHCMLSGNNTHGMDNAWQFRKYSLEALGSPIYLPFCRNKDCNQRESHHQVERILIK